MSENKYLELLRNAVYSTEKAIKTKETLDVLGYNWHTLKEQIKTIRLQKAPIINNLLLSKYTSKSPNEVDILIKLIPYF